VNELLPFPKGGLASHEIAAKAPRRILVVDDNIDAATSLAMLLQLDGHDTRVAHSGAEALAAATGFAPHFVLLDIGLPDLSGYEVARRLRSLPGLEPTPRLIALTGWGQAEDRARSREAGFEVHLVKPVDPADLGAVLDYLRYSRTIADSSRRKSSLRDVPGEPDVNGSRYQGHEYSTLRCGRSPRSSVNLRVVKPRWMSVSIFSDCTPYTAPSTSTNSDCR
jgi:CheY-like chemotaxis protein